MTEVDTHHGGFREGSGRKLIPGRLQPLESVKLFESTQDPPRRCNHTIHLWDKDNHRKNLVVTAYCGCWNCSTCREYIKRKWINYIHSRTIFGKPGDWSYQASVFLTTESAWNKSVKKLLGRRNVDFVRIRMADGKYAVINNGNIGYLLSGEELDSKIKWIFSAISDGRRPVTTSDDWQLPQKVSNSRWVRVNSLRLTQLQLQDELDKKDLHSEYIISDKEGIIFEFPNSWTEDEILEFARYLASLTGKVDLDNKE